MTKNNNDKLRNVIKDTAIVSLGLAVAKTANQDTEVVFAGCTCSGCRGGCGGCSGCNSSCQLSSGGGCNGSCSNGCYTSCNSSAYA